MKYGKNTSNIEMVRKMQKGERPITTVGYAGEKNKFVIRKVGDKWTDLSGKEWAQTDSGPQTVNRVMDIVRAETNYKCSSCKSEIRWGTKQDEKIHSRTGMCLACLTDYETDLKLRNVYEEYEKNKLLTNQLSYLQDMKQKLGEAREYASKNVFTYVNSNGMVEEWSNNSRTELLNNLDSDYKICLKAIKDTEKEIKKLTKVIKDSEGKK